MSSLPRRNYGGFPRGQFGSSYQRRNRYNEKEFIGQQAPFAPFYPTRPYHQSTFNGMRGLPAIGLSQLGRYGMNTDLLTLPNQLDAQYRYNQYLNNNNNAVQNRYWKGQSDTMSLTTYGGTSAYFPSGGNYEYIVERRYIPYPIYVGPGGVARGASANLGYGHTLNLGYTATSNSFFGIGGGGRGIDLPPKIRMIFMPTQFPHVQQPCAGPLTMPPFLYNCMSQPLCSLPPPPPLPQIASLPLSPAIQQMVMQRYANPFAVLPFTSNWPMSQPTMPNYPQFFQQQSMMPMSPFQSFHPAPQSFQPTPQPFQPAPQLFQPAPQSFQPTPQPFQPLPQPFQPAPQLFQPAPESFQFAPQSFQPTPQPFQPAPQPFQSAPESFQPLPQAFQPAPQPFMPPAIMPDNPVPSIAQYPTNSYPSICRACPPAPPPLDIPVKDHYWMQHCSACHHVPAPTFNPNSRPTSGRITPLNRYPAVSQYVGNQPIQQYRYPHTVPPNMGHPSLHNTLPLPPGAIVISDEYITKDNSFRGYRQSQQYEKQYHPFNETTKRLKAATLISPHIVARVRSELAKKKSKKSKNSDKRQPLPVIRCLSYTSSSCRSSCSSTDESTAHQETTVNPSDKNSNVAHQQLLAAEKKINFFYKYDHLPLTSVYHTNRYLKSSSEDSMLSSNYGVSPGLLLSSAKNDHQNSPPISISLGSIKVETLEQKDEKFIYTLASISSQSKKRKEILIIVRKHTRTRSPSTNSSILSDSIFSIIGKDCDSISITSKSTTDESVENSNIINDTC